jgi:signal transduction histidine kinase
LSWTSRLLPRSLRVRLILSFGALIFLSLFFAGTATVYLLKEKEESNARERVGLLAEPISLRAAFLEANNPTASPEQIQTVLVEEYPGVRILLTDRAGFVLQDSADKLDGSVITQVSEDYRDSPGDPRYHSNHWQGPEDDLVLFWTPRGLAAFQPSLQTVVAVAESDVSQAWQDLLPRLFLAGGLALLVGIIAAGLLARSISRPLRQITTASEAMARGQYDQQIPNYGPEEIGRLARAFNDMARQVGRSHRTLRDFLANVSHELKTPLTSVQGFSQAMSDGSLTRPEDYAEAGRIINDEAVRMRGLVDDLLYLSQVEAGEFNMQLDKLSANELLKSTQERFARRATQAGIVLELRASPVPRINADGRRLEQALANIVDNAVRHTPRGGRVTLGSLAQNGSVRLSVHNTGSVIPPEALLHVFDRFYQADPAGARADANTGLGLAITKEIVEAHGGAIEASSNAASGTSFVITLPATADPPQPEDERAWARPDG